MSGGYKPTDQILFEYFPSLWQWGLSFLFVFGKGDVPIFHPRYIGVVITLMTSLIIGEIIKDLFQNAIHQTTISQKYQYTGIICYLLIPTVMEFGTSVYVMPWLSFLCVGSIYLHMYINPKKQVALLSYLKLSLERQLLVCKYSGLIWIFCLICLKATTQSRTKILKYGCLVGCVGSFFTYVIF